MFDSIDLYSRILQPLDVDGTYRYVNIGNPQTKKLCNFIDLENSFQDRPVFNGTFYLFMRVVITNFVQRLMLFTVKKISGILMS